jgi:hypothetical protein
MTCYSTQKPACKVSCDNYVPVASIESRNKKEKCINQQKEKCIMYMPPSPKYEDLVIQEAMQRQKQPSNQQLIPTERSMSRGKYLLLLGLVALSVLVLVALALYFLYS